MKALFATVARDHRGRMNFYEFRAVVDRLRDERVAQLRKMFPDVVIGRDSLLATLTPPPVAPLSKQEAATRGIVDPVAYAASRELKKQRTLDKNNGRSSDSSDGSSGHDSDGKRGHRRNRSLTTTFTAAPQTTNASGLNTNTAHSFVRSAPLPSLTRSMAQKKKIPSHQSFTVTHRLISRYAHVIAPMAQKNNVDLALNVRLMRDEY